MRAVVNHIKLNTSTYGIIVILVIVLDLYYSRNIYDPKRIFQKITENFQDIKHSITVLEIKMQNILKNQQELSISDEKRLNNHRRISTLPYWDFTQLSNLNNFRFINFNNVCTIDNILLLIFVNSKPDHIDRRNVIRNSWGNKNITNMRLLFSLGAVNRDKQIKIQKENSLYKDILQGNFIDTYNNLTYKHIMNLKYITYYCPQVKYFVKMDDDFFIHTPNLIKFLQNGRPNPREDMFFCYYRDNVVVLRNNSKWDVTYEQYPNSNYPRYCLGNYPIIYRYNVAFDLYKECQKGDFFYIEDVYITGIIAKRLNLQYKHVQKYMLTYEQTRSLLKNGDKNVRKDFLYGYISLSAEDITKLWNIYKDSNYNYTLNRDF